MQCVCDEEAMTSSLALAVFRCKKKKSVKKLGKFPFLKSANNLTEYRLSAIAAENRINSHYLAARTPPPPPLSRQTGPDTSLENSSWSLHCQWSGKLSEGRGRKQNR